MGLDVSAVINLQLVDEPTEDEIDDCEGTIGTPYCKKLAEDFNVFSETAEQHENERFKRLFFDMKEVFCSAAAGDGIAYFH